MTVLEFARPATLREPPGIVSTALGDETIEFAESCDIFLDPWQQWCVRMAMAERAGGSWAAFEAALVTPRQNGKNYYLRALQLGYLFLMDDDLLIHSAHQWDTVNVHRKWLMEMLESHTEFGELLKPIDRRTGRSKSFVNINGDEQIVLTTGQAIVFKTRSGGKGRGFTGDKVFFDEAQKLGAGSMGDTIPILSTRPGAQVHYTGSAPNGQSEVLHSVLTRGRGDDEEDQLFVAEWGNTEEAFDLPADSPEFLDAIRNANPAVSAGRISEDYIRQEIRTFSGTPELVEEHRRERLGVPTIPDSMKDAGPIDLTHWNLLVDASSMAEEGTERLSLVADDGMAWFGIAGVRPDGLEHCSIRAVTPIDHPTDGLVARAKVLTSGHGVALTIVKGSEAWAYVGELEKAGVTIDKMMREEAAQADTRLVQIVKGEGLLRHRGDPRVAAAIGVTVAKETAGGLSSFVKAFATANIAPLIAVSVARGRLTMSEPPKTAALSAAFG